MIKIELLTNMLDYQQKAYDKLNKIKVNALYLEMGLGKTRIAIEMIKNRMDRGKINRVLWLCPCTCKLSTQREIEKHSKGLIEHTDIIGIESISMNDRTYLEAIDIVSSYDTYLIVDESNLVKNFFAKRTKRIIELSTLCEYKTILNGTPVTRNEIDLYAQWYILDNRIFGYRTFWSFANNHLEYDKYGKVRRVLNVDYLTDKIAPYSYILKKDDAGLNLPEKSYNMYYCVLEKEQSEHYEEIKNELLADVDEFEPWTLYRLFTVLQMISSGRRVTYIDKEKTKHEPFFDNYNDNPRIQILRNYVENLEGKCIIWCKYRFEAEDIEKMLLEIGKQVNIFHGGIVGKKRDKQIDEFKNSGQFLIGIKSSGGYGLNLQFCNEMIYYSEDFDWGTRQQSEDRSHRIGLKDTLFITDIMADTTIEDIIWNCQFKKISLDAYISELLHDKNELYKVLDIKEVKQ